MVTDSNMKVKGHQMRAQEELQEMSSDLVIWS